MPKKAAREKQNSQRLTLSAKDSAKRAGSPRKKERRQGLHALGAILASREGTKERGISARAEFCAHWIRTG
jgi:hypothetical protein